MYNSLQYILFIPLTFLLLSNTRALLDEATPVVIFDVGSSLVVIVESIETLPIVNDCNDTFDPPAGLVSASKLSNEF
jgi:hypothetical protein